MGQGFGLALPNPITMQAIVQQSFIDKQTKKAYKYGDTYEGSEERIAHLQRRNFLHKDGEQEPVSDPVAPADPAEWESDTEKVQDPAPVPEKAQVKPGRKKTK